MVDISKIEALLSDHFQVEGSYGIDPDTGVVNVQGNIRAYQYMSQLPVQFGTVSGDFCCKDMRLRSLKGSPSHVGGTFWCSYNLLNSLSGSPSKVKEHFMCDQNLLTNLQGGPGYVGGNYLCSSNKLTSLRGAPTRVGTYFCCDNNLLTNMDHAPECVSLHCEDNVLVDLKNLPKIKEEIVCAYNKNLPVLRLLASGAQRIYVLEGPATVDKILDKYMGQGKQGILRAAAELVGAGFRENAIW